MILVDILQAISNGLIHVETRETDREVVLKYRINSLSIDRERLGQAIALVNQRDRCSVSIKHDNSDQETSLTESAQSAIDEFCDRLELWADTDSISGVITLRVKKTAVNRTISIYSLDRYCAYLNDGNIIESIDKIGSLAQVAYAIECSEVAQIFNTHLFVFKPFSASAVPCKNPEPTIRPRRLELRERICAVYGGKNKAFVPNDFRFNNDFPHRSVREIFKKLEVIHSLISISDITKFESSGHLSIAMKGYSSIKLEVKSLKDVDVSSAEDLFEIFEWIYTDGNIVDKVGISRNLISIHAANDNLYKLKPGCLESIASNYIIYLKDNLKQYIDVKNKLSDQIQKTSEKAADVVKSINAYLRGSIFSVYSFVFSVFLIRTIGKSDSSPIFTSATYAIFILFILISVLVLLYAIAETNAEIRRFKKVYEAFRERYTDLITREDLSRILSNDADFERDLKYIRKTRKKVVALWIASLLVIFVVITAIKDKSISADAATPSGAVSREFAPQ